MKIVNTIKVLSALVCLSNFSFGSQGNDEWQDIQEPPASSQSPVNEPPSEPDGIPVKTVSNFDYYVSYPATAFGIFLYTTVASPFVGFKSFYHAATGYEVDGKVDRCSKFREGLALTVGAPLVGVVAALAYLYSKNGGN